MGVQCQILIQKPREGVHRAGYPVNGVIRYALDKPTEYKNIMLSLIGSGKCWWTEVDNNDSTTYTGTENYISQHMSLLKTPGKSEKIPAGTYDYPFQFILPENIPPSIKSKTCYISYNLKVKFTKTSLFSFVRDFQAELTVCNYVTPTCTEGPVIFGLEKSVFQIFSPNSKFNIKAQINTSLFARGENAKLSLIITNDTDIKDWSVITALQCSTVYTSNDGNTNTVTKIFKESETEVDGLQTKVTSMSRVVPILPELYTVQDSKIIARNYNVLVTLKLPAPHINAHAWMPIIVGVREPINEMSNDVPPIYFEHACVEREIPSKNQKFS